MSPAPRAKVRSSCRAETSAAAWSKTDRKSTRLNSSHSQISYAVFCLKKKKKHSITPVKLSIPIPTSTCTHTTHAIFLPCQPNHFVTKMITSAEHSYINHQ